jgi:hypothetical protein
MELDSGEMRAPSNSGKDLERLVGEIERSLLPSGFEVVLNKTEFDDAGDQIAEFDIVISGRLGSSLVNWLIECRDRPSQGPAPGSWLEQLAGRKTRFKFDKVIAVSTTGFAPGARQFAESRGISVRSVQRIADIGTDFNIQEIKYYAHQVTIGPTDMKVTNPTLAGIDIVRDAKFKLTEESDYQSFADFVSRHVDVERATLSGDTCFRFEFCCEDALDVVFAGRQLEIRSLSLPLQLDILIYEGKMLSTNLYSELNEMIGRDVMFGFELPTGSFTFRALFLNNFDGTQKMRVFPPENVPDGFTVEFLQLFAEEGLSP